MSVFGIDISEKSICLFPPGTNKRDALDKLVDTVFTGGASNDREALRKAVHEREAIMSTGIGQGIAIPHVRVDVIVRPTLALGVSQEGIDFDTLDNEPVYIILLFAMPAGAQKEYLGLLAQAMKSLKDTQFRDQILKCHNSKEVEELVNTVNGS